MPTEGHDKPCQTVAARLPKNMKLLTTMTDKSTTIAIELTLSSADEARALIVALEKAIIPLFAIAENAAQEGLSDTPVEQSTKTT